MDNKNDTKSPPEERTQRAESASQEDDSSPKESITSKNERIKAHREDEVLALEYKMELLELEVKKMEVVDQELSLVNKRIKELEKKVKELTPKRLPDVKKAKFLNQLKIFMNVVVAESPKLTTINEKIAEKVEELDTSIQIHPQTLEYLISSLTWSIRSAVEQGTKDRRSDLVGHSAQVLINYFISFLKNIGIDWDDVRFEYFKTRDSSNDHVMVYSTRKMLHVFEGATNFA